MIRTNVTTGRSWYCQADTRFRPDLISIHRICYMSTQCNTYFIAKVSKTIFMHIMGKLNDRRHTNRESPQSTTYMKHGANLYLLFSTFVFKVIFFPASVLIKSTPISDFLKGTFFGLYCFLSL